MHIQSQTNIFRALDIISHRTTTLKERWVVGGSVGLMLRGIALPSPPRDLDLYCDAAHLPAIHQALGEFAEDDPMQSRTSIYDSILSHYVIEGVSVELVGGFSVEAHDCLYQTQVEELLYQQGMSWLYPCQQADGELNGESETEKVVKLVPLAHELWFNALRDRPDRCQIISEAFAREPFVHEKCLQMLESRNKFTASARQQVHAWLKGERVALLH